MVIRRMFLLFLAPLTLFSFFLDREESAQAREIACELAQQKAYQNKWKSVFALCCRRRHHCLCRLAYDARQ